MLEELLREFYFSAGEREGKQSEAGAFC